MWTRFIDMHSGGGAKLDWEYIYIEASREEAEVIFYNRFGRDPNRVTCSCCGEDYGISDYPTLEQATAYERGCDYDTEKRIWVEAPNTRFGKKHVPLQQYLNEHSDVLVIRDYEIADAERQGNMPARSGWVWVD